MGRRSSSAGVHADVSRENLDMGFRQPQPALSAVSLTPWAFGPSPEPRRFSFGPRYRMAPVVVLDYRRASSRLSSRDGASGVERVPNFQL